MLPQAPNPVPISTSSHAPEDRPGLALELTQLFVLPTEHRRDDINVFEELMRELYADAPEEDRRRIALLLAGRADLPASVAAMIASDRFDIAEPMLRFGNTLATIDRIRIIGNCSEAHRSALASRGDLEDSVLSALLLHSHAPTIEVLAANPVLHLTGQQADHLIDRVVEAGANVQVVADRLALGTVGLIDHFFDLDPAARRRALMSFDAETAFRRIEKRGRRTPPVKPADLESRLLEAVIAGDYARFGALFSATLGIDEALAQRIVRDPGGEPLVIALSAAGIDAADATSLFVRSDPAFGWSYRSIRDLVRLQETIGWRAAEAVLDRWAARDRKRLGQAQRQTDGSERVIPTSRQGQGGRSWIDRARAGSGTGKTG